MRRSLLTLTLFSILAFNALSQDAPPVDVESIRASLKALKEKQAAETKTGRNRILQTLNAAAQNNGTAIDFYAEAVRATQFEGQNREQTQFHDWKKKETDKLRSHELQTAARLHLAYLVLTLQRANGSEIKDLMPALVNYTNQVTAERDSIWDQDLMKRSVSDGIFARWYQLAPWIAGAKDWEMTPGNVDGIFTKSILPVLREAKDRRLLEYWDQKLQDEQRDAQKSGLAFNADKFEQTRKPALLWSRAQDELVLGLKNRAISDMFALVKNNPGHPSIEQWTARLEAVLSGATGEENPPE